MTIVIFLSAKLLWFHVLPISQVRYVVDWKIVYKIWKQYIGSHSTVTSIAIWVNFNRAYEPLGLIQFFFCVDLIWINTIKHCFIGLFCTKFRVILYNLHKKSLNVKCIAWFCNNFLNFLSVSLKRAIAYLLKKYSRIDKKK